MTAAQVVERLQEACETGELIKIIYHGGTQPGTLREIFPIGFIGGKLRARCLRSNSLKLFALRKIELGDGEQSLSAGQYDPTLKMQREKKI